MGESLAVLAARLGAYARTKAREAPDARVRLARPLEAPPAAARLESLLSLPAVYTGGAEPGYPYAPTLGGFQDQISACLRCSLGPKRRAIVFGEGDIRSPVVFVGTAPGFDEEAAGSPLAGAAGNLFDRIIAAMGFKRPAVYVCNLLKCRSPVGKEPAEDALSACVPYLGHQLALIRPRAVVALGGPAARLLAGSSLPLAELRGRWAEFQGLRVMPTYHPADLLSDEGLKRHVWEDLKLVLKVIRAP